MVLKTNATNGRGGKHSRVAFGTFMSGTNLGQYKQFTGWQDRGWGKYQNCTHLKP
jgi:hypothetical protein